MTPVTHSDRFLLRSGFMVLALSLAACPQKFADPSREMAEPVDRSRTFDVTVHQPDALGVWDAPLKDKETNGEIPERAACITCHGPSPTRTAGSKPGERFHTTVEVTHGDLACEQCHDADHVGLHLADGTRFDFADTMRLCAQCHGPQYTDYNHGGHGGMNGYWDLHQGPRVRNNCVDCHAPHAPAYPTVMPVFRPRGRYLQGAHE